MKNKFWELGTGILVAVFFILVIASPYCELICEQQDLLVKSQSQHSHHEHSSAKQPVQKHHSGFCLMLMTVGLFSLIIPLSPKIFLSNKSSFLFFRFSTVIFSSSFFIKNSRAPPV